MSAPLSVKIEPGACAALPPSLGGKGAGLLKLINTPGIRVPEGVILTGELFKQQVRHLGLETKFSHWCHQENHGTSDGGDGGNKVGSDLAQSIQAGSLAWSVAAEIRRAVDSVWGNTLPALVVRSSASTEDQSTSSAAGRFKTVMPVWDLSALETAVRTVWASMFLRGDHAQAGGVEPTMGVVVQRLIPAIASGVAIGGRDGVVLESVSGLAGLLVEGAVRPDVWEFDATGRTLLRKTVVARDRQRLCTHRVFDDVIPPRYQFRPALSDKLARSVARRVSRLALAEGEVDLEFCIDAAGQVYFVQLRPLTRPVADHGHNPVVTAALSEDCRRVVLGGVTASWGAVAGRLVLVEHSSAQELEVGRAAVHLRPGDILVTSTINIGATHFFPRLAGIVAELGGTLSHTALLAREFNKPAIVGAARAISHIRQLLGERLVELAPGIFAAGDVTLDANLNLLFDRRCATRLQPLVEALERRAADSAPDAAPRRASEWPHYIEHLPHSRAADLKEGAGGVVERDWTGKPEYRLCHLQLDLSLRAWKKAFRIMELPAGGIQPGLSVVSPYPSVKERSDGARIIGSIRPMCTRTLSTHEYLAVAFPTDELCGMGDQLCGESGDSPSVKIPELVQRIHRRRKAAFRRLERQLGNLSRSPDVLKIDWQRQFETYSTAYAFAHLRATFRRRVAIPLRERALRLLPEALRTRCEALATIWGDGLATETTHARDVAFRELMFDVDESGFPVDVASPPPLGVWLRKHRPDVDSKLQSFAATYKFDRSEQDTLETEPPYHKIERALCEQVAHGSLEPIEELQFRTSHGYRRALQTLRPLIHQDDPRFDFDSFVECFVLAREIPAMTDHERHLQHRHQQLLRRALLDLQLRLREQLDRDRIATVFNCQVDQLLSLIQEAKHNAPVSHPASD